MKISLGSTFSLGLLFFLSACSGGAGGGDDGRMAAVQTALDANPTVLTVPNGKTCHSDVYWGAIAPDKFKGLGYVEVKSAGSETGLMGTQSCTTVTWSKSANVKPSIGDEERAQLPVGRYVVDKVGEEQDGPMGSKVYPYKAHFEVNAIGKDMIARHMAQEPPARPDSIVALHKDADGKWVAQLEF